MNTTLTTPPPEANTAPDKDGKGVVSAAPGSALDAALALVDFGSCRGAERPQDWLNVAGPMCEHCEGEEDVNLAAARIIATEYRKALAVISAIEERYIDGCDTYEDWKFMGTTAREYLLPPNVQMQTTPESKP
jgi:hypothetical protein